MGTHKLRYHFVLTLEDGDTVYLSELGITPPLPESVLRRSMFPMCMPEITLPSGLGGGLPLVSDISG
mgnify:CR=1 FL=1